METIRKKKLQANILDEHRRKKFPTENQQTKLNIIFKNLTLSSSVAYPQETRIVPYMQINKHDTPY